MRGWANVFGEAGEALVAALDRHEREHDPAKLLDGEEAEVARRWACSAVQLRAGAGWLVVPRADPVQFTDGGRRACRGEWGPRRAVVSPPHSDLWTRCAEAHAWCHHESEFRE